MGSSDPRLHLQPSGSLSFWQLNHESPVSASSAVSAVRTFWTYLYSTCGTR